MSRDVASIGSWDIVLRRGVLYQAEDPLRVLRRLAAVTRRQAIFETEAGDCAPSRNSVALFPSGEFHHDRTN
jgi:hypothetical protein